MTQSQLPDGLPMGSGRPSSGADMVSRFSRNQAGEAILQLYSDRGNPAKRAEWVERIKDK